MTTSLDLHERPGRRTERMPGAADDAHAARRRLVRLAPVAGIPIEHRLGEGIEFEEGLPWAGSHALDEPVIVEHAIGDTDVAGMRILFHASSACTYYTTAAGEGEAAVKFGGAVAGIPDQLLLTRRPGYEYELVYAHAPAVPMFQRAKDRTILSMALAHRGRGCIAHATGFVVGGAGVLCPGLPSAGKSTLARLLQTARAPVTLLSDDRVAVTVGEGVSPAVRIWGTPWPGDAQVIGAGDAPLRAIVLLRHAAEPSFVALKSGEAVRRVLETLVLPLWSPASLPRALELVHGMLGAAPVFELAYPPTAETALWLLAELSRHGIDG